MMKKGFIRQIGKSISEGWRTDVLVDFSKYACIVILMPIVIIGLLVWLTGFNQLWISLVPIGFILMLLYFAYDSYESKGCS